MQLGSFLGGAFGQINKENDEVRLAAIAEDKAVAASKRALANSVKLMEATEVHKATASRRLLEETIARSESSIETFLKGKRDASPGLVPPSTPKGAASNPGKIQTLGGPGGGGSVRTVLDSAGGTVKPNETIDPYLHIPVPAHEGMDLEAISRLSLNVEGYRDDTKYYKEYDDAEKVYNAKQRVSTITGQSMSQLNQWGMRDESMSAYINETTGGLNNEAVKWNEGRKTAIEAYGLEKTGQFYSGSIEKMHTEMAVQRVVPYSHNSTDTIDFLNSKDDVTDGVKIVQSAFGINRGKDPATGEWIMGVKELTNGGGLAFSQNISFFSEAVGTNSYEANVTDTSRKIVNTLSETIKVLSKGPIYPKHLLMGQTNAEGVIETVSTPLYNELKTFYTQSSALVTDADTASAYESLVGQIDSIMTSSPTQAKELKNLADKALFNIVASDQKTNGSASMLGRQLSKSTRERLDAMKQDEITKREDARKERNERILAKLDEADRVKGLTPEQLEAEDSARRLELDPSIAGIPTEFAGVTSTKPEPTEFSDIDDPFRPKTFFPGSSDNSESEEITTETVKELPKPQNRLENMLKYAGEDISTNIKDIHDSQDTDLGTAKSSRSLFNVLKEGANRRNIKGIADNISLLAELHPEDVSNLPGDYKSIFNDVMKFTDAEDFYPTSSEGVTFTKPGDDEDEYVITSETTNVVKGDISPTDFTKGKEGFSATIYNDPSRNKKTDKKGSIPKAIGYGFRLKEPHVQEAMLSVLGEDTYHLVFKGVKPLGKEEADRIFDVLLEDTKVDLTKVFSDYESYPDPIKAVLLDSMYNAGYDTFTKSSPRFIAAIKDQNWKQASIEVGTKTSRHIAKRAIIKQYTASNTTEG